MFETTLKGREAKLGADHLDTLTSRSNLAAAYLISGQLDRATGSHVVDVLLQVADEVAAALVVTTHDRAVAARLDQQWPMHSGQLDTTPDRRTPVPTRR